MHSGPLDIIVGWPETGGRGLVPGDLEPLCDLLESVQPGSWSRDQLRNEQSRTDGLSVWMRRGAVVVAALIGRTIVDELHILELATAEAYPRAKLPSI